MTDPPRPGDRRVEGARTRHVGAGELEPLRGSWKLPEVASLRGVGGIPHDGPHPVPALERSHELAVQAGDKRTMSYALRHLGIAEHMAGRLDAARERLEESVRLRREIGHLPGVAANLVGLAYIAVAHDRPADARAIIEEARAIAEATGAHGILRSIELLGREVVPAVRERLGTANRIAEPHR